MNWIQFINIKVIKFLLYFSKGYSKYKGKFMSLGFAYSSKYLSLARITSAILNVTGTSLYTFLVHDPNGTDPGN